MKHEFMSSQYFDDLDEDEYYTSDYKEPEKNKKNWGEEFQEGVKKRERNALIKIIIFIIAAIILCYFL